MPRRNSLLFPILFAFAVITLFSGIGLARKKKVQRHKKPAKINRVFVLYPELRGSRESLRKQNYIADKYNLSRIKNEWELKALVGSESGFLVNVPDKGKHFYIDKRLVKNLRYLSPRALGYLRLLAAEYAEYFGGRERLKITSLVRTIEYQRRLSWRNPNAVWSDDSELQSVHPTGFAFDISTKRMKQKQILWLAQFLAEDEKADIIEATYEPRGNDFHIMVFPLPAGGSP